MRRTSSRVEPDSSYRVKARPKGYVHERGLMGCGSSLSILGSNPVCMAPQSGFCIGGTVPTPYLPRQQRATRRPEKIG